MKIYNTFEQFLTESLHLNDDYTPILEGGAAGHMSHPFDNNQLTFGDFKEMINAGLSGSLNFDEEPTEKTDGQNVFATIQNGEVKFARNKGDMKTPMSLSDFKTKFEGHPSKLVQDTFQFAADDLAASLIKLPTKTQDEVFANGLNFMNMELIYSLNPNVIHYDVDVIQFHGVKITDGEGNITGEDNSAAKKLAGLLKDVDAHIQKTFSIIPPQVIKIGKDINFDENKAKFIAKVDALRDTYGLTDADTVSRYHEMWWRDQINSIFPDATQDIKEGLLLRWAYDDKKTLNIRDLEKMGLSKEQADAVKKFDKDDVKKKYKENIRPFEDLFLELGSIILKNASNFLAASPDAEMQRLHNELRSESDKIKANGDLSQIAKVEAELARLDRIGGIESIIPTEGLVFTYKGHTYKLTGTFAAVNQLMGFIKYGR
jgi:hypothetical protein